ncbi:MAG: hypothetical protein HGA23_05420 [Bacteroidales bacterium]|nr:hypothetical protein [Bacteroidales bacterium]
MKDLNWDRGKDDEELFEFAMHDRQYRDFKSGEAKNRFDKELENAIKEKLSKTNIQISDVKAFMYPNAEPVFSTVAGTVIWELDFVDHSIEPVNGKIMKENEHLCTIQTKYGLENIQSFCNGRIVRVLKKQGEMVSKGEKICLIEGIRPLNNN